MGDFKISTLREGFGWGRAGCQALAADARHESDRGYSEGDNHRGGTEPYPGLPEARQDILDEERFQELIKCAESPWFFLTHYAYTQDPVLGIAGYPAYPFLRKLTHSIYHNRLVLIPKSRQMLVS